MLITMLQTEYEIKPDAAELERLLLCCANGDRDALTEVYSRTRAAVYALSLSMLANHHDAQDAAQDTFVSVFLNAGRCRAAGSPMAWILTIAKNICRMRLRQQKRIAELSEDEWLSLPDSGGIDSESRHILVTALGALTRDERRIVLLHSAAGLKHRETAELLEMPLPTVLSKYHRALKKLRALLKGDDPQ